MGSKIPFFNPKVIFVCFFNTNKANPNIRAYTLARRKHLIDELMFPLTNVMCKTVKYFLYLVPEMLSELI